MKHTDTATTLALIDATLRLTEPQLWHDPEFLAWEAGQVDDAHDNIPSDLGANHLYGPGPAHWVSSPGAREVGLEIEDTVQPAPMVKLIDTHSDEWCRCETHGEPSWSKPMRVTGHDYPPIEDTVHGPLLLGPELK